MFLAIAIANMLILEVYVNKQIINRIVIAFGAFFLLLQCGYRTLFKIPFQINLGIVS